MPKPFAVLLFLVERAGRLVTHDQLLKAVWPETHVQADVLRRYIMEIRRALGDRPESPRFIQTFPKRGFQFVAPVVDEPDAGADLDAPAATRLVGRASALTALERHLASAAGNRRQVAFVVGEPGIGKTSVIDAFQRHASRNPHLLVARGQCVEGFGSKEPYYPVLEALGQLVRGNANMPVVEALAAHAPTWMIQFRSFVREEQRATLQRELLGATRERMVRELCEALEVITQAVPILIILEDLHWADPSTLDFVSAIARRREPAKLLLVGSFRPGDVVLENPLKTLSHDLKLHQLSHEVVLERLLESDVSEYLAQSFAPAPLPRGLASVIHKHSDGNPLFMIAMLDHLDEQGVLAREDGHWALRVPLEQVDPGVPDTLRQMLELQLDHLTSAERRLLECASVAGQHFSAWSVTTMLNRDAATVEELCQALADGQQFLVLSGMRTLANGTLTLEYEFKHALYREVLYRRLQPRDRVEFHRRLAVGLESLRVPAPPELAAEIALHFEEGREYERAVRYLVIAASNATRRHAYRESIDVLEQARAALAKAGAAQSAVLESQILESIGDAQYTLGDVQGSLQTYDLMAVNAASAGLRIAEATALMRLAHPAAFVDSARCVDGCERAATIGAAIKDPALEAHARLLASCWRIMIDGWRPSDAEASARSLAALRRLGTELPPYDQILCARVQILDGRYSAACKSADRALRQLTEAHALWVRAKALSTKALALLYSGRLGDAHQTVTTGIELAKRNENAPWLGILLSTLAWLRCEAHDFAGVDALSSEIEQSAASTTGPLMWRRATANVAGATMRIMQGFADLAFGRHDAALQRFEAIRDQRPHPKVGLAWQRHLCAQVGLSETWLALGEWNRAATEADALVKNASEYGDVYLRARAWETRARVALLRGRAQDAAADLQSALDVISRFDVPLAAWRVHATAWKAFRRSNSSQAAMHRAAAGAIIRGLVESLAAVPPLRESFLAARPIRDVFDEAEVASSAPTLTVEV